MCRSMKQFVCHEQKSESAAKIKRVNQAIRTAGGFEKRSKFVEEELTKEVWPR